MNLLQKTTTYYTLPFDTPFHCGIIGKEKNRIAYTRGLTEIRADEKKLICELTGIATKNCLFLNQVHGDAILVIDSPPAHDSVYQGNADAMISNVPGICLVIRTADCVPVCAYDAKNKIIAAIHSGWKGTELCIVKKTIQKMKKAFGSKNEDITVAILPAIGPSSYEVQMDVAQFFPDHSIKNGNNIYLNLWKHIEDSLQDEGILPGNIYNSETCTVQQNAVFFSHRKGDIGRNLIFCYMQ